MRLINKILSPSQQRMENSKELKKLLLAVTKVCKCKIMKSKEKLDKI